MCACAHLKNHSSLVTMVSPRLHPKPPLVYWQARERFTFQKSSRLRQSNMWMDRKSFLPSAALVQTWVYVLDCLTLVEKKIYLFIYIILYVCFKKENRSWFAGWWMFLSLLSVSKDFFFLFKLVELYEIKVLKFVVLEKNIYRGKCFETYKFKMRFDDSKFLISYWTLSFFYCQKLIVMFFSFNLI